MRGQVRFHILHTPYQKNKLTEYNRAHRIGQIRDVHIYRFISQYTVEEAMLRKANQKRSLDDIVIQKGDFDWKSFFRSAEPSSPSSPTSATPTYTTANSSMNINSTLGSMKASALQKALVEFEDFEDAEAAKVAAREEAEKGMSALQISQHLSLRYASPCRASRGGS